mmetsp:Transcript_126398/g.188621  ORF Transcript_126398/g.188621 Transcript_126398/m.188621 type:complete len:135 (-) Transcript_126398:73-477(-)
MNMTNGSSMLKCKTSKAAFKAPRIVRTTKPLDERNSEEPVFQIRSNRPFVFPVSPKFDIAKLYKQHTATDTADIDADPFYSCKQEDWNVEMIAASFETSKPVKGIAIANTEFASAPDDSPSLDFLLKDFRALCR